MEGSAEIRQAVLDDVGQLIEIYSYYVENTAVSFEYDSPSEEEFRSRMAATLTRYPYLVAVEDGVICGFAYAGPFKDRAAYDCSCEVTVYLDHAMRRRGTGRLLYSALESELAARGIVNMYACIAYPEEEDEYLTRDSAAFHERLGFTVAGRFRRCARKFDRWYDMIWMEKRIG